MRFFDRKFSLAILFITLPLLFLPKINLISVDIGETAGLRIDDLALLFVGIVLMWAHALSHQRLYKIEGWILLITAWGVFSFLINRLLVSAGVLAMDAKIFYTLRLLEYFLFFYIGAMASQFFQDRMIIKAFFLWNLLLMILQKLNLAGAMAVTGYRADVSARVQGIASFPSEMGLLLNLLFCYFVFNDNAKSRFISFFRSPYIRHILPNLYLYGIFCLFGTLIIFTGNRISLIALFICFIYRLKQEINWRAISSYLSITLFASIVAITIGFVVIQTAGIYNRSQSLFSWSNMKLFSQVWDKIDIHEYPIDKEEVKGQNYDVSWWLRVHKWLFMAKSYLHHPECYLQGLGPGYAGSALDGGLLRILTEYGLVGVFLFWKFFARLYRLNRQTKWMMIAFLINMIFFDAYLSYKTMSLLLFVCGYIFERQHCLALNKNHLYVNCQTHLDNSHRTI